MKITETIFAQLTDADTLLESVYQAIAEVDPDYTEEMANNLLPQVVPGYVSDLEPALQYSGLQILAYGSDT